LRYERSGGDGVVLAATACLLDIDYICQYCFAYLTDDVTENIEGAPLILKKSNIELPEENNDENDENVDDQDGENEELPDYGAPLLSERMESQLRNAVKAFSDNKFLYALLYQRV
jgi:hypothetical protein